jgi:hypothetical protein
MAFNENHYQQLIALCWKDEVFKKELMSDPHKTLKLVGLNPPAGVEIKVVENSVEQFTLVIPPNPAYLSAEHLEWDRIAGGGVAYYVGG